MRTFRGAENCSQFLGEKKSKYWGSAFGIMCMYVDEKLKMEVELTCCWNRSMFIGTKDSFSALVVKVFRDVISKAIAKFFYMLFFVI